MKRIILLLFVVFNFIYSISFSQSTSVAYGQQSSNYNYNFTNAAGFYNASGTQLGLWANGAGTASRVVLWRPFTTDGSATLANRRSLQIGDQFIINGSFARAYGRIGLALLSSPTTEASWNDAVNNYALAVNVDGPDFLGGSTFGNWYVQYNSGSTSAALFGGNQGSFHQFTFSFTATAPDRMNVSINDVTSSQTYNLYDVLLNSSNPITDYSIYLQNDWDGGANQNEYFGLPSGSNTSINNTGVISVGASNNSFTISGILADALYANQNSGATYSNALTKAGTGTVTFTGQNTYTGLTTVVNGTLQLNYTSGNTIPVTNNVSVNGGTLQISSNQTLNNLTLANGATLIVDNGVTLTINGTFLQNGGTVTNNGGTISYGTNAILNYGAAQTTGAELTATVPNLTISAGSGNTVVLNNAVTVTGTLTPTSGTLSSGGNLTISPTASVASGSGSITGNVTVQENLTNQRGWRILGSPFTSAVPLINLAASSNIDITYGGPNIYGGTSAASAETYVPASNSWTTLGSSDSWAANSPMALFIRGTKGQGIPGSGAGWISGLDYGGGNPTAVTLTATGTLNTATYAYGITPTYFNIVPNPFAATISVQGVIGSSTNFYYYNPAAGAADVKTKGGSYVPVIAGTDAFIPKYGCFVYTPASGSSLNIPTSAISIGSPAATVMGTYPNNQLIELVAESNGVYYDKMFVQLDASSSATATDSKGLKKFYNDNLNLYSITPDSNRMAIDARNVLNVVPLGISAVAGNYDLKLNTNSLPEGTTVYLEDQYLKTQTALAVGNQYSFTINADAASKGENRFKLVFGNKQSITSTADNSGSGSLTARILGNVTSNNLVAVEIAGSNGPVTIAIKDMSGKAVGAVKAMNGIQYINVGNAGSGMLIIQVSDSKSSVIQKLIKL